MNTYKRNVLLGYVSFLMVMSWFVILGGVMWGIWCGYLVSQVPGDIEAAAIMAAFGGTFWALGVAVAMQVVAQLVRCLVRIEEHLETQNNREDEQVMKRAA